MLEAHREGCFVWVRGSHRAIKIHGDAPEREEETAEARIPIIGFIRIHDASILPGVKGRSVVKKQDRRGEEPKAV